MLLKNIHILITRIFVYIPWTTRLHIPPIHIHITIYKVQYTVFAHLIVLHILLVCTFLFIAHFTLISLFLPYICSCVVLLLYNFYFNYFALSTERTWFVYISLLIIPCIIYYVTNKKPWTLKKKKKKNTFSARTRRDRCKREDRRATEVMKETLLLCGGSCKSLYTLKTWCLVTFSLHHTSWYFYSEYGLQVV